MVGGQVTSIAGNTVPPFTTLKYTTKDGENCVATKNNGVVTIQGDKNGVRQMPLNEFLQKELMQNVKPLGAQTLERSPSADTVAFSGNPESTQLQPAKKNKKGWLIGIGLTLLAAGVYYLTRGRVKPKATQVNEAAETAIKTAEKQTDNVVKNSKKVETVTTKMGDAAENFEAAEQAVKSVVVPSVKKGEGANLFTEYMAAAAAARSADSIGIQSGKRAAAEIFGKEVVAGEKAAAEVFGKEVATGEKAAAEVFGKEARTAGYADDVAKTEVPAANRGSFGQDLDDALDPLNQMDVMSPHYGSSSSVIGSNPLGSFGFF